MKNTTPIKRSKQLTPFSREHHDALLFVWKIKRGLENNTAVSTIENYIHWFWKNHLEQHFFLEEKLLLAHLDKNKKLADRLLAEHKMISELIETAKNGESISSLINLLNDHVRFEERELFPYIESSVSEKELDHILGQLEQQPPDACQWNVEFWQDKK